MKTCKWLVLSAGILALAVAGCADGGGGAGGGGDAAVDGAGGDTGAEGGGDSGEEGGGDTGEGGDTLVEPDTDTGGPDSGDAGLDASLDADTTEPTDTALDADVGGDADTGEDVDATGDADAGEDADTGADADTGEDGGDTSGEGGGLADWEPLAECDAGDLAWAKQVLQLLLGRNPASIHEVRLLADMVAQTDRETVARALMATAEFEERWALWFMDQMRINRIGDKKHAQCYGPPLSPDDQGEIAAHVRDSTPLDKQVDFDINMSDVLRSSLRLDDISPFYRAHLFAMMTKPITGANVAALEMDITRRQDFGEIFSATYTHRNVVCATCHNSEFSTTDDPDPAKDRFFTMPGKFEKAIYGDSFGRPEMEVYSVFRRLDVFTTGTGRRPWNMDESCGKFVQSDKIPTDPAGYEAFFIQNWGLTGSIWQLEDALREGFDMLRADGLQVDPGTLEIDGREAFAYMVCARLVDQIWREAYGYGLTLVHYFPRNAAQRDLLLDLTTRFVDAKFSIRQLLVDIVTHPPFNQKAPIEGCAIEDHPYVYPAVFNPWVLQEEDPAERNNSTGDALHRANARVMLRMIEHAIGTAEHPKWPSGNEEEFQKAVGVFLKDAEPGFSGVDFQGMLTWEDRFGACAGVGQSADGTVDGGGKSTWLAELVSAVKKKELVAPASVTVGEVAMAVKDRLHTSSVPSEAEAALIAALFGAESLDTPVAAVTAWEQRTAFYCGVLVNTPQFLLLGAGQPAASMGESAFAQVPGTSYAELCESVGATLLDPAVWSVSCDGDTVSVTPKP
jgi:hypothetical protein